MVDTLYHYCSNSAFHSIISNQEIWLTSLSLSNDTREGKVVLDTIRELAIEDGQDKDTVERMINAIHLNKIMEGLGFCLSEKKDLLSQWRGYADDASGVAIGFSKKYFEELSQDPDNKDKDGWNKEAGFRLNKVLYKNEKQKEALTSTYAEMKKLVEEGALNYGRRASLFLFGDEEAKKQQDGKERALFFKYAIAALPLFTTMFTLKGTAFEEEHEWRLISMLGKNIEEKCSYMPCSDIIKPYRAYTLKEMNMPRINEIILGPKNRTPEYVIKGFLNKYGFKDVNISVSTASYR
jgi:hypothetical protein